MRDENPKNSLSSPDVILEVGPQPFTRFPAHSAVLSSQSGYFRAAISRMSENNGKLNENLIFLPNINVEHFSPLLSYMYTGYLDLNFENIFGVLLATHLLHMPRALELCRDFLAHTQRQNEFFHSIPLPPKVIRPIPSKASNFGLNFISAPKASSTLLLPSVGTKFKSLTGESAKKVEEEENLKKFVKIPSSTKNESSEKVVIDIASCDGPVRFRRVLNDAFEKKKVE